MLVGVSLGDLFPRPHGQHGGKECIRIRRVHGGCMLLDALSIPKDQSSPQTCKGFL